MVSKKTIKLIKSLHQKKYRKQTGMFLVEGAKSVLELLQSHITVRTLVGTEVFIKENSIQHSYGKKGFDILTADEQLLSAISSFKTNNAALAVAAIPDVLPFEIQANEFVLVLDEVRDPGNLGTIIRIADWYGIEKIVCSPATTDVYNPKVIHASMGSFLRVNIWYRELKPFLEKVHLPVYGAFLEGQDIHSMHFEGSGILVLGNESEGISRELESSVQHRISIPRFGSAESLNVAVATAVICDNIRRQQKNRH